MIRFFFSLVGYEYSVESTLESYQVYTTHCCSKKSLNFNKIKWPKREISMVATQHNFNIWQNKKC